MGQAWRDGLFLREQWSRESAGAREAAGDCDIRISGGADVIQQDHRLGVIEELEISLAPVIFGGGRRLFENLSGAVPPYRIASVLDGPSATHLRCERSE